MPEKNNLYKKYNNLLSLPEKCEIIYYNNGKISDYDENHAKFYIYYKYKDIFYLWDFVECTKDISVLDFQWIQIISEYILLLLITQIIVYIL